MVGEDTVRESSAQGNLFVAAVFLPFVRHDLALTPKSLGVLLFLGVVQIALVYTLFVRGLKHVTATQATLTGMLEPVMNPVWVVLFLGERPSVFAIAGGLIVLAAIGWHTMTGPSVAEIPAVD